MTTPALKVSGLNFEREQRHLLEDINFSIQAGELVGIIGPNGAGKSTLLKSIAGIHQAHGQVEVYGCAIGQLSHSLRAQKLSYLAQYQQNAFAFSAQQTIELASFSRVESARESCEKITRIAELLGITALLPRKMDQLSGGETQLVHFARILHQQAPLLLLDEPTASLDIGHEAQLMNLLKQQCHEGSTALVAIHNLNVAAAFCDRLILLDKGKLIASGRPEQVITQQRMQALYEQQVIVSQNPITGTATVLPLPQKQTTQSLRVHLIGGAGSTVVIARNLLQMGVKVTGGIAHEQDTDTEYWQTTGIEHIKVPAFDSITDQALSQAAQLVAQADITILCEFPIGPMNLLNLNLASQASQLWVLQNSPIEPDTGRFANQQIAEHFAKVSQSAISRTTCETIEAIQQILFQTKALPKSNTL